MSHSSGPWPGRFVWHDFMTTDAAAAQRYYVALFGWQIHEMPMGEFTYRMIMAGPGPIGGIVEEKGIPASHWMPYVAVDDVDAAAARCTSLGGSVCVPPTDIPQTGRFAVVGDPQGAYFTLYKGLPESSGADPNLAVPGRVCWNELLTTDDAAARRFYEAMFGWTTTSADMGPMGSYHTFNLGEAKVGGLMKHPMPGAPSCWQAYFYVEDLKASTDRAKALGGTPLIENQPIEGIGAFSLFADPTGGAFALFAMATR